MASKSQHVVPRGKKWAVRKTGAERVTRYFATQKEAVEAARRLARKQGAEVVIHGRDGRIRERGSCGKEHSPPTGQRHLPKDGDFDRSAFVTPTELRKCPRDQPVAIISSRHAQYLKSYL